MNGLTAGNRTAHVTTASIKKPIHNVKEERMSAPYCRTNARQTAVFISRVLVVCFAKQMVEPIGIEPMT
ncbi:hypothetical protein [Sphingobium sp. SCG-1]|uniref:hypothetical protein n=1 Tax=Sphingobium sp. SCG-1 TaxID=2072936 RepID=UPI001671020E|nr:hypothetical protein [Sphingobium sp. SCG-1]